MCYVNTSTSFSIHPDHMNEVSVSRGRLHRVSLSPAKYESRGFVADDVSSTEPEAEAAAGGPRAAQHNVSFEEPASHRAVQ
jgi:hypothetical protein